MIILECPGCKSEIEYDSPSLSEYDENMDEKVTCSSCGWASSKWSFDYIREENKEVDEDGSE